MKATWTFTQEPTESQQVDNITLICYCVGIPSCKTTNCSLVPINVTRPLNCYFQSGSPSNESRLSTAHSIFNIHQPITNKIKCFFTRKLKVVDLPNKSSSIDLTVKGGVAVEIEWKVLHHRTDYNGGLWGWGGEFLSIPWSMPEEAQHTTQTVLHAGGHVILCHPYGIYLSEPVVAGWGQGLINTYSPNGYRYIAQQMLRTRGNDIIIL